MKHVKLYVQKKAKHYQLKKIFEAAPDKTKVRDLIIYKTHKKLIEIPKYITKLIRKECSYIFKTRARMMDVKGNFKNKYPDSKCRWCNHPQETQKHILIECSGFKEITNNMSYHTYFQEDAKSYEASKQILGKVYKIIEQQENEH